MHAESSENEDGEQLWISPKLPRASTHPPNALGRPPIKPKVESYTPSEMARTRPRAMSHTRPRELVPPRELVQPRARALSQPKHMHTASRAPQLAPRLSAAQTLAWYAPRIVLLFALGWAWSTGVQFIHAQADARLRVFGDYDTSDSDDEAGGVVARVLGATRWGAAACGAVTVCVGLGLPFLDCRWQRFPRMRVEWNDVLRCAGGFLGVNYAALKLPFESANQSALIMLIISLGLWTVCDGSLHGLLLAASASLACTWVLCMHVLGLPGV
ncbi:hypothetical protein GGF43_002396, partial [Coemansia sp. RSA 2618]